MKTKTRKGKLVVKDIKIGLFNSTILVAYNGTAKEAANYIEKNYERVPSYHLDWLRDDINGQNKGVCLSEVGQSANIILWLSEKPSTPGGYNLLAHESTHAAYHLMKHWSFEINDDTQELMAMIVGYIVHQTLK